MEHTLRRQPQAEPDPEAAPSRGPMPQYPDQDGPDSPQVVGSELSPHEQPEQPGAEDFEPL